MKNVNEFRISIAIEDPKSDGMTLLVAVEVSPNSINLDDELKERMARRDLLPHTLEGSFSCSRTTWMRIKGEAMKQGAQWSQGVTKTKTPNTFWSSKPKITVIHVRHNGLMNGEDPSFRLEEGPNGQRLMGNIDERIDRVVVRERRVPSPIEGL